VTRELPIAYVTLAAWAQCRYWLEIPRAPLGFPDTDTMFVHRVKTLSDARAAVPCLHQNELLHPEFTAQPCGGDKSTGWSWQRVPQHASCYSKRRTQAYPCNWGCINRLKGRRKQPLPGETA